MFFQLFTIEFLNMLVLFITVIKVMTSILWEKNDFIFLNSRQTLTARRVLYRDYVNCFKSVMWSQHTLRFLKAVQSGLFV